MKSVRLSMLTVLILTAFSSPTFAAPLAVIDYYSPMMFIQPISDLPDAQNPTGWTAKNYDLEAGWQKGAFGIGYGEGGEQTQIKADAKNGSVYTRATFNVADANKITAMTFQADYDDGYIVWLNGVEICRSQTMNDKPAAWNSQSGEHECLGILGKPIDVSANKAALVTGENVLAIGLWNTKPQDDDLVLFPRLTLYDAPCMPQPLHTYLTYQDDPSTSITVNYQTGADPGKSIVFYDTQSRGGDPSQYAFQAAGQAHRVPGLDPFTQRNIHWVKLTGLKPGTTYYFVAGDPATGTSREIKFKTIPAGDAPVRFTVGGDVDTDNYAAPLHRQSAAKNTMFAWMTGDLAICNGKLENWERWDIWLSMWEDNMVTPDGCLVPMVLGIGNHECGPGIGTAKAPFYFGYFAQDEGKSYFTRRLGNNLAIFVVDSGMVAPTSGEQAQWLDNALADAAKVPYRITGYHVPAYPSNRDPIHDKRILDVRANILPLIDKYRVTASLEGHDHVEKRTKPMRDGKPKAKGTVFLGDGYGTQGLRPAKHANAEYMAHSESRYHLWLIEIPTLAEKKGPTYTAIDPFGVAFDTYTQKNKN